MKNKNIIRILIADDHPIFRHGLRSAIEQEPNFQVVGEAENGSAAVELVESLMPDIVILDVDMPIVDGIEAAGTIRDRFPDVKTLFLTLHKNSEILASLERMNVRGYLLKDSALAEVVNCVDQVMTGKRYISPEIIETIFAATENNATENVQDILLLLSTLTPTESRILTCVARSMTNREIAESLFISVRTAENHRSNICSKLNLHGNHSLLRFAIENKEIILREFE